MSKEKKQEKPVSDTSCPTPPAPETVREVSGYLAHWHWEQVTCCADPLRGIERSIFLHADDINPGEVIVLSFAFSGQGAFAPMKLFYTGDPDMWVLPWHEVAGASSWRNRVPFADVPVKMDSFRANACTNIDWPAIDLSTCGYEDMRLVIRNGQRARNARPNNFSARITGMHFDPHHNPMKNQGHYSFPQGRRRHR